MALPKIKDGYIAIHGHFYQPPRESPWLEAIETEESAHPFHDWNERIALECYRPNAHARLVDEKGKTLEIINNYSSISFNFGPTLLPWLEKHFPSVYEVEIDEGPKGEGTSWSCAHGVGRWKEDCGCSTGGKPGWNQKWRKPLREALDLLRDELSLVFEKEGEKIFQDGWEARNGYIEVILKHSPESIKSFFERY